jgi:hypothetical protein
VPTTPKKDGSPGLVPSEAPAHDRGTDHLSEYFLAISPPPR